VRNNHGGGYSYRLCPASEVRDSTHPFRQRFVLSQELCEREKPILNVPRQARDNHTRERKNLKPKRLFSASSSFSPQELSEACFQKHPLEFDQTKQV
jgi:hypothetical protein